MAESNALKLVDVLKSPNGPRRQSAVKKNAETAALGKIYNFLVKDREDKNKRQVELNRIQQESAFEQQFITTDVTTPTATVAPKIDKKEGMFGGLGMLGIVAVGAGAFIFSKEIQEKIDEMKVYFEESTWMDAFDKFKELFDFSDLMDQLGLGPISEDVERAAQISDFNKSDLNILSQGGKTMLGEEEFKRIQSQHRELEGKLFTDVEANIAAQGFKAKDIQSQLGTTDITQTYAAEKIGVESTKKLYAAKETESAVKVLPEAAQTQKELFYKPTGEERTVGEVREMISAQAKPPATGGQREVKRRTNASAGTTQFVKQIYPHAKKAAQELNVPVEAILGQAIQESGGGKFVHNYNLFNQTAGKNWKGDVVTRGDTNAAGQKITQKFKAYNSYGEAFDDYVAYIKRRQKQAIGAKSAYEYGAALKSGGYAEDPGYAQHIAQGAATAASIVGQMTEAEKNTTFSQTGFSSSVPQQEDTGISNEDLTYIRTSRGIKALVHKSFAPNFQGFINDLEGTGYKIKTLLGYADRNNVNNPSVKSYHALGAAIDINPENNPNRSTQTDLPPITSQLAAKWGLGWGMNWRSVKDPMHFSIAKAEQGSIELARGSIAPGEQMGVPTGANPVTQIASVGSLSIPSQDQKLSSRGGNTIIVSQNQVTVASKKVTKIFDNGFRDMSPQDIINGGIIVNG